MIRQHYGELTIDQTKWPSSVKLLQPHPCHVLLDLSSIALTRQVFNLLEELIERVAHQGIERLAVVVPMTPKPHILTALAEDFAKYKACQLQRRFFIAQEPAMHWLSV